MKTRTAIVVVALAASVAPAASTAQDATGEARASFQEGVRHYAAHRYAEALEAFRRAYRVRPHPSVLVNIANCYLGLEQPQQALSTFERYLADNPSLTPDQRAEIEGAMANARRHLSTLQVLVQPAGAEVYLDGDLVGTSPLRAPLERGPGPHVLEARIHGGSAQQFQVRTEPGGSVTVTLDLVAGRSYIGGAPAAPAAPAAIDVAMHPPPPAPLPPVVVAPVAPRPPPAAVVTLAPPPEGPATPAGETPLGATVPTTSHGIRVSTWIGGAVTVAAAGAWVGFALYAQSLVPDYNQATVNEANAARAGMGAAALTQQGRGRSIADAVDQNNRNAYIFGGITGAAAVFTLATILWPRSAERPTSRNGSGAGAGLSLVPTLNAPGAVLSGSF